MGARTDLTFDEFVEFQFGRAVRKHGDPWYFDLDADWWEPDSRTGISYLKRLFSNGPKVLQAFSDDQIAQGLECLINTAVGWDLGWASDRSTQARERAGVWASLPKFFAELLAPRCTPSLGHLSEDGAPLNLRTYMWWEGFPALTESDDPQRELVDAAELDCLEAILRIDSVACQEAALHGLGHLTRRRPRRERMIDRYLTSGRARRPELLDYANAARSGCVQ